MVEVYKMKFLALAAALFFADASGEVFFGALRIDAASNERLGLRGPKSRFTISTSRRSKTR